MTTTTLSDLGWSDHFARAAEGAGPGTPMRVSAVNRADLHALAEDGKHILNAPDTTGTYAVGDWVLAAEDQVTALLPRQTLLHRRAAGERAEGQLIAANVDTLGIVSSCNADFNVARLERYLALAASAGCLPLIILTKADQTDDPDRYRKDAERLGPLVTAIALDATDPLEAKLIEPWCRDGQTLALVGSSGVGKTTLQNALTGVIDATQGIREDDAHGRHTTTARALRRTTAGGWLIDTPGMRALRLTDMADGIDEVFSDVTDLADGCKFRDCQHETEPGCAVQGAIAAGQLDPGRLARWQKLMREDARNNASIAEVRQHDRARQKMYSEGKARSKWKRGD